MYLWLYYIDGPQLDHCICTHTHRQAHIYIRYMMIHVCVCMYDHVKYVPSYRQQRGKTVVRFLDQKALRHPTR